MATFRLRPNFASGVRHYSLRVRRYSSSWRSLGQHPLARFVGASLIALRLVDAAMGGCGAGRFMKSNIAIYIQMYIIYFWPGCGLFRVCQSQILVAIVPGVLVWRLSPNSGDVGEERHGIEYDKRYLWD